MKVQWSSTYMMLNRAYSLRTHVEEFILQLSRAKEQDDARRKMYMLIPTKVEWERVKLFQRVLGTADECQQQFSGESAPALHLALPALEEVHATWTCCTNEHKFDDFYIKENWSPELHTESVALVKKLVPLGILRTQSTSSVQCSCPAVLAQLSSDEDNTANETSSQSHAPSQPNGLSEDTTEMGCECAFHKYLELEDGMPDGMSILNGHHYPVWGSLARDYLAIMATSVSSERAFFSAGITITKWRNRLKGDIVEALQVLKNAFWKNMFFREYGPSRVTEMELEACDESNEDVESGDGLSPAELCQARALTSGPGSRF
ncbi:hypothetical protein CERSUDRAFT_63835 [Gelatoporia subvermispora B]|uniref:HAT C-terminal dimerisation domain-containing protein n=1 Tax=Ceriporiopsis subvermispora (strain B) TaxID=914234 RepID=M2RKB2_CERS8|nr:hypothetical protein CERSUDRAFT_63835 [Gelatoporia subvermispora B]